MYLHRWVSWQSHREVSDLFDQSPGSEKMKFLIAGLGSIGRRHLRNLLSLGEKDIILYRTGKSSLPEDELGSFTQETNLQRALDKYNPAAVIVSNPTSMHLDVAIPAAERGCSILLEKPPSDKPEKLEQLRSIVAN